MYTLVCSARNPLPLTLIFTKLGWTTTMLEKQKLTRFTVLHIICPVRPSCTQLHACFYVVWSPFTYTVDTLLIIRTFSEIPVTQKVYKTTPDMRTQHSMFISEFYSRWFEWLVPKLDTFSHPSFAREVLLSAHVQHMCMHTFLYVYCPWSSTPSRRRCGAVATVGLRRGGFKKCTCTHVLRHVIV